MDQTIILSEVSRTIANLTGCTIEDAENFMRELFALAYSRLEQEGRVEIPEVGTWINDGEQIIFAPDAELAAAINAPFAAFEAIELPANYDEEAPVSIEESNTETEDEEAVAESAEFEEAEDAEPTPVSEPEPVSEPAPELDVIPESVPEPELEPEPEVSPQHSHSSAWLWWLPVCVLFFGLGWGFGRFTAPATDGVEIVHVVDTVVVGASADTIAATLPDIEKEAKPIVTDTVTRNRFLTTMARKHYGQMEFWVYIYEANTDKLGHPDYPTPGTVLVIPDAEELGLKPGDPEAIRQAIRKAMEIYGRFN